MRPRALTPLLAVAVAVAACGGQSKEEQATNRVCDARADLSKQVDTLKGLTLSTATSSQIQDGLKAIGNDLKTITDAQGDLSGERKQEVEQANQAFAKEVKDVASTVLRETSTSEAKTRLTAAFQDLAATYEQSFAKVDCTNA
jgi:hypothetical protein